MVVKRLAAIAFLATGVICQGVFEAIPPKGGPPAGCVTTMDGQYELSIDPLGPGAKLKSRAINPDDPYVGQRKTLKVTLKNGILKDSTGATGYIADNRQFQFDNPPQTGAIYTSGFSFCKNGTLALGPRTTWVQCLSGSFYNLYDVNPAGQCQNVAIGVHSLSAGVPTFSGAVAVNTDVPTRDLSTSLKATIPSASISSTGSVTSTAKFVSFTASAFTATANKTSTLLASNLTSSNGSLSTKVTPTPSLSETSASASASTSAKAGAGLSYLPMSVAMHLALVAGIMAI